MEEVEELRQPVDRHLNVLDHGLALGALAKSIDTRGHGVFSVERDELPVHVAPKFALGPQFAYRGLLGTEGPRAPEPIGVPAPQIIVDRQEVFLAMLNGAVVNLHARVVAGAAQMHRRRVHHFAEREVLLVRAEHRAIEEVHADVVIEVIGRDLCQRILHRLRITERYVPQVYVLLHRLEFDL